MSRSEAVMILLASLPISGLHILTELLIIFSHIPSPSFFLPFSKGDSCSFFEGLVVSASVSEVNQLK